MVSRASTLNPVLVLDACHAFPTGSAENVVSFEIIRRVVESTPAVVLVNAANAPAVADSLGTNATVVGVEWSGSRLGGLVYTDYRRYALAAKRTIEALGMPVMVHRIMPVSIRYAGVHPSNSVASIVGPIGGSRVPLKMLVFHPPTLIHEVIKFVDFVRLRMPSLLRRYYAKTTVILASTDFCRNRFPDSLRGKVRVVREGIESLPFDALAGGSGVQHVVYVGRLTWAKGCHFLLRALHRVSGLPWRCTVVGEGPERPRLERYVERHGLSDRVVFTGALSKGLARSLMRDADICCFPGVNESVGQVNMEAMSLGRPVIAADWAGPAEVIGRDCGVLVPVDWPWKYVRGLERAIRVLLDDTCLRQDLGKKARERAQEQLGWDQFVARLFEIYEELGLQR